MLKLGFLLDYYQASLPEASNRSNIFTYAPQNVLTNVIIGGKSNFDLKRK